MYIHIHIKNNFIHGLYFRHNGMTESDTSDIILIKMCMLHCC